MKTNLKLIRRLLLFFMITLFISGLTAIPVEAQLSFLTKHTSGDTAIHQWLQKVLLAYREVNKDHPFLLYGYDLAGICSLHPGYSIHRPLQRPYKKYLGHPVWNDRLCISVSPGFYCGTFQRYSYWLAAD